MGRAPIKKPGIFEQAVEAANEGVRSATAAAGAAIRTTSEVMGRVTQPWVERAALGVQQIAEAVDPAGVRERNLASDIEQASDYFDLPTAVQMQRQLQPVRLSGPQLPPPWVPGATPEDIEITFRRASGMPLPNTSRGRWPAVELVNVVSDLPPDNKVWGERPSRAYLPYVERLTGTNAEYMNLLLGKESPRDTLDEKNPASTATGPGQMTNGTAITLFKRYGAELGFVNGDRLSAEDRLQTVRHDRRWAVTLTARYQTENAHAFRQRYGKHPTWAQVREMHFFGDTPDFHSFNAAPDDDLAINHVSAAARISNKFEFYETYRDAAGRTQADYSRPRTVAGVKQRLHGGWPEREFTDVAPTKSAK